MIALPFELCDIIFCLFHSNAAWQLTFQLYNIGLDAITSRDTENPTYDQIEQRHAKICIRDKNGQQDKCGQRWP